VICDFCKGEVHWMRMIEPGKYACKDCDPGSGTSTVSLSTFPFTTTNLTKDPNKPVVVESMRHLRQLERQHGVQSVAYNMDARDFDIPPRGR
jgi:hypothetical protein